MDTSLILYPFRINSPLTVRLVPINLPLKKFSKVVLPQPEGPKIAVKCPGYNLPEILLRMVLSPTTTFFYPLINLGTLHLATTLRLFQIISI